MNNTHEKPQPFYKELFSRLEFTVAMKIGLASCLSLYLGAGFAKILDRPDSLLSGTWCVISTLMVMQAHLGGTYRAAWVRFLGVLIGSFMGGLFTSIFGSNGITVGISVVLVVLTCSLLLLKESIRIASLSLVMVMVLWGLHPSVSPWTFGLFRFLDSALGIIVAVFVSHTLWPAQATQKMRLNLAKTLHYINRLYQLGLSPHPSGKHYERIHRKLIHDITRLFEETRHFLKESELELLAKTRSLEDWTNIIDHIESIFESTVALQAFQEKNIRQILDQKLMNRLTNTMDLCVATFKHLIHMLKTDLPKEESIDLRGEASDLNEELTRFRLTRTTRKFDRQDVEHFFVFFYNLRTVMEELIKVEARVRAISVQSDF